MTEIGVVTKLKGTFAEVEIGRHSACAQCGKCGMKSNQKKVQFFTQNSCDAKVGDRVELDIPDINTLGLAVVAYLIPLVFAVLFFVIASAIGWPDWALFVSGVVGLAVAFAVIAVIDKAKKHKWVSAPTMNKIIITEEQQ